MRERLFEILALVLDPGALKALVTWPTFSVTSYGMVASLRRQGVKPNSVIDVGANTGQFAVAAAKLFQPKQVLSFEPLPNCAGELEKHAKKLGNISVFNMALGDRQGETELHVNAHSHSSSLLSLASSHQTAFPEAREIGTISVPLRTLDAELAQRELFEPILMKLDVQGYEAHVLRGATETLQRVDYVVMETSFREMYVGEPLFLDMVQLMDNYGFSFLRPVGWLRDPHSGEILQMDALFARR